MDHDPLARFQEAEHFARHVSEAIEAIATLLDDPDVESLDLGQVPEMFTACSSCTIEALLYLAVLVFRNARWDGARLRAELPVVVSNVLAAQVE